MGEVGLHLHVQPARVEDIAAVDEAAPGVGLAGIGEIIEIEVVGETEEVAELVPGHGESVPGGVGEVVRRRGRGIPPEGNALTVRGEEVSIEADLVAHLLTPGTEGGAGGGLVDTLPLSKVATGSGVGEGGRQVDRIVVDEELTPFGGGVRDDPDLARAPCQTGLVFVVEVDVESDGAVPEAGDKGTRRGAEEDR